MVNEEGCLWRAFVEHLLESLWRKVQRKKGMLCSHGILRNVFRSM